MSAGIVVPIPIDEPKVLAFGNEYKYSTKCRGTIALDGEREIEFGPNEDYLFRITRNGPFRVQVKKALETAQKNGFFNVCDK
jgi:hypothetical protein